MAWFKKTPKENTALSESEEALADVEAPSEAKEESSSGWLSRLKRGLGKTSGAITESISGLLTKRRLDADLLQELEDALIMADLGVETAAELVAALKAEKFDKEITDVEVRTLFAQRMAEILAPVAKPLAIDHQKKPFVITVVGVNGTGKTTTIGKLAKQWQGEGYKVMIAAADTFRAAAVQQLQVWGERSGCEVIAAEEGADPASVAFRAHEVAAQKGADILMVDTAGRLHNKAGLMEELRKILRVISKRDETAPHATILVLDATVGQNALKQVETFKEMVAVTGLVVTKLDGTAKGGVVVALAKEFGLPVHAIGVGEGVEDLRAFQADVFANSVMGIR